MNATTSIRSRSNNVFLFNPAWGSYSRVLWHDAGGPAMYKERAIIGIPENIKTIELDLTSGNKGLPSEWERIRVGNIRAHCTAFDKRVKISGKVPDQVLMQMCDWLAPETIELLLHIDYMSMIEISNLENPQGSGGVSIDRALRLPMKRNEYLSYRRSTGAGPGLLMHDIQKDYDDYVNLELKRQAELTPNLPLLGFAR